MNVPYNKTSDAAALAAEEIGRIRKEATKKSRDLREQSAHYRKMAEELETAANRWADLAGTMDDEQASPMCWEE